MKKKYDPISELGHIDEKIAECEMKMEDWFDEDKYYTIRAIPHHEFNNDTLMAKYWAAEEMAKEMLERIDYDNMYGYPSTEVATQKLRQLFKKEWFR